MLIAEDENKTLIDSGVSNVYKFYHADFEGVEFYAVMKFVHLKKEGKYGDFFVSDEEEEDDEVIPVSEIPLLVEKLCVVLKFWIYNVWIQGIIQTLLMRTRLISNDKKFLSTTTTTLPPKIVPSP